MRIREYCANDAQAVAQLFVETVHSVNAIDYTPEQLNAWAPETLDAATWCAPLAQSYTLIALLDDKIAGFANLLASGYLDRLYVSRDCQRMGVATALVSRLEQKARALGLSNLLTDASITAVPFFTKQGYHTLHENAVIRRGVLLTNYTMEKKAVSMAVRLTAATLPVKQVQRLKRVFEARTSEKMVIFHKGIPLEESKETL